MSVSSYSIRIQPGDELAGEIRFVFPALPSIGEPGGEIFHIRLRGPRRQIRKMLYRWSLLKRFKLRRQGA